MLVVKDLWAGYSTPVLKGVTFQARPGEILSIIGPNRAGKSTLLRCLAGIIRPFRGQILVEGENIDNIDKTRLAELIGYVPQESKARPLLTVLEYVILGRLGPRRTWRVRDEDIEAAYEALYMLGIEHLAERRLDQLSGGQRQLVDIAQALAKKPKILLLDEPTSALDIKHQYDLMELVEELTKKKKLTTIAVHHDLNIVIEFSDKTLLLNKGEVEAMGRPTEVITPQTVEKVYGIKVKRVHIEGMPRIVPIRSRSKKRC